MTACPTGSKCVIRITAGMLAYTNPNIQSYAVGQSNDLAYDLIYCMLYNNFQVCPRPADEQLRLLGPRQAGAESHSEHDRMPSRS